jgi:hypothetical protein
MMLVVEGGVMAEIIRFVIRFSPRLHEKLKAMAEREHRSLHSQIVYLLEKATEGEA